MLRVSIMAMVGMLAGAGSWGQSPEAARGYLDSLDDDLAKTVTFKFDDDAERKDWSNLPARMHVRHGLSFGEMNDAQKTAAHRLLQAGLSSQGYAKTVGAMHMDDVLAETYNKNRPGAGSATFGSDKYWMAIFGKPDAAGDWGWQIDGHHLGVNYTSVDGKVSMTPMFFGAEPDIVLSGSFAGWRVFASERAKALALVTALNADQREKAVVSDSVPDAIFEGPKAGGTLKEMIGIPASELDDAQRQLLWDLISEYLDNAPRDVAETQRAKIVADGDAALHFAWMGPLDDSANIYFRVHGPSVLIEYDNVSAGPKKPGYTNHIHTILREPGNDYGEDLLRKHYAESEHHRH
jgi:Protein of unknown function (DUF3500)